MKLFNIERNYKAKINANGMEDSKGEVVETEPFDMNNPMPDLKSCKEEDSEET